jgi:hypothetical protein
MARLTVLKCSLCFNLINYLVAIMPQRFGTWFCLLLQVRIRYIPIPFGPLIEQLSSLVQGAQQIVMILVRP